MIVTIAGSFLLQIFGLYRSLLGSSQAKILRGKQLVYNFKRRMKNLGLALLSFTAILISQVPMSADSLPVNLPMCYMITSRGVLLNLDYMCGGVKTTATYTPIIQRVSAVSSRNRCRLLESQNKLARSTVLLRESEFNALTRIYDRQQADIRNAGGTGNFADLELDEKKDIIAEKLAVLKLNALTEQRKFEVECY